MGICRGDVRSEERSEILACGSSEIRLSPSEIGSGEPAKLLPLAAVIKFRSPLGCHLFHYRRDGGNFAIHIVDNFAHGSSHEFRCPSGQFRVRATPAHLPRQLPIICPRGKLPEALTIPALVKSLGCLWKNGEKISFLPHYSYGRSPNPPRWGRRAAPPCPFWHAA